MDEYTSDVFANRDEPVPLLTVTYDDVDVSSSEFEATGRSSKRSRFKRRISPARFKGKAQDIHAAHIEKLEASPDGRPSLQDRLFAKLLQQVIPLEDQDEAENVSKIDRRSSEYVQRPAFSLPTMTNNFRRFNARIGIVFVFQNRMIRLFTWRNTTQTLSFLAVYTFVCLNPYLLVVVPLALALLFVMVPAFVARHPPPPPATKVASASGNQFAIDSYSGPPIAPARTIRPAAETSKDFFRNMRDLQNSMADFANLHDTLVKIVAPATNFSDEVLSSTVFLYLFLVSSLLFISAHLIPFRAVLLIGGQALTISGHPRVQEWLVKQQKKAEKRAAEAAARYSDVDDPKRRKSVYGIQIPNNATTRQLQSTLSSMSEITLSTTPETREVEVFELQHRPIAPPGSTSTSEWTPYLFTPTPYDPLSPSRIAGDRPRGTRFFEDVQPPDGWEWHSKKWALDLEAGEWVNDRLVVGVEYDVIHRDAADPEYEDVIESLNRSNSVNADFGGWVWDLPPAYGTTGNRDEEVWLAYGDYNIYDLEQDARKKKRKAKKNESGGSKDWEESIRYGNRGRTGEWRRRRWVRMVQRKEIHRNSDYDTDSSR